jgi:hypothetical protein
LADLKNGKSSQARKTIKAIWKAESTSVSIKKARNVTGASQSLGEIKRGVYMERFLLYYDR